MSDTVIVKDGFYRWTHMTWSWASVFDNAYDVSTTITTA
jgi:hypothetical protein